MADEFTLGVGQAHEFELALKRVGGWNAARLKLLCEGDRLARVLDYTLGLAEIKQVEYLVDLDADPFVPNGWSVVNHQPTGWSVVSHQKGGQFKYDPAKVGLYLSKGQQNSKVIVGNELYKELKSQPVYNANLLDFYLKNPHLIPEKWKGKGKAVFFWGTIYRDPDGFLSVRCLCWIGGGWDWSYSRLDDEFNGNRPAAVSAS